MSVAEVQAQIESLLATRQQLQGWLDRLAEAGGGVPNAVRDRVRADYEGRLAEVVFELRNHSAHITGSLDRLRHELGERQRVHDDEEDALAEAELRHAVGEFDDATWASRSAAAAGSLAKLNAEINRLTEEITRLQEVLVQITPEAELVASADDLSKPVSVMEAARRGDTPGVTPEEPSAIETQPTVDIAPEMINPATPGPGTGSAGAPPRLTLEHPATPEPPIEAPRFIPKSGVQRESGPAKTIRFPGPPAPPAADELAFLKSVSLEGGRPSGSAAAGGAGGSDKATSIRPAERPSQVAGKTLKCVDCGAMNRPTEWYCERCGAELAAL